MDDVSSNEVIKDPETESDVSFNASYESGDEYVAEPQTIQLADSSVDYSSYFENIETTLKFQTAVIIGFLLLVGFVVGWKHD